MPDRNKLDTIGQDLRTEMKGTAKKMAAILKSGQRLGMRRMTPEEQALKFLQMTPVQRQTLKAQYGEEIWASYEEKQINFLFERIGPAAVHVLPYVAPNLALALQERADQEMTAFEGGEVL